MPRMQNVPIISHMNMFNLLVLYLNVSTNHVDILIVQMRLCYQIDMFSVQYLDLNVLLFEFSNLSADIH